VHLCEPHRASVQIVVESVSVIRQKRRKELLASILSEELPTLPSYVLELNTLLSSSSVDLKRVGKVIRNDPSLSAHVLRMCNSALFNLRRRVLSIEEAAVLMGAERLRTLVLTSSVMDFAGKKLSREHVQDFWSHSFMTGMLSQRIAQWLEYPEPEQAYLGGLLHDIGVLPLMIAAGAEDSAQREMTCGPWGGSLETEKDYFGTTHCEIGRSIGLSWNFFPSFIDVFENHHQPEQSSRDRHLVGIIAAADHFCEFQSTVPISEAEPVEVAEMDPAFQEEFLSICFPQLNAHDRSEIAKLLETEYPHLLPMVEMNGIGETPMAGK
jgi:HD-like signal output (HDOD) protein